MISLDSFNIICYLWLAIAVVVHVVMFFYTAPFGRHTNDRWGPLMDNKLGWIIMEFPSLIIMIWFLLNGTFSLQTFAWIPFVFWIIWVLRPFILRESILTLIGFIIPLAYSGVYQMFFDYRMDSADFSSNDADESAYSMAVVHFFRTVTKMFFANDGADNGRPPPILILW